MVMNRTFAETRNDLQAFRAQEQRNNSVNSDSENTVVAERDPSHGYKEYPAVGRLWEGPLTEDPHANPKIDPDRLWQMPGLRSNVMEISNKMGSKYWSVYQALFKSLICGMISLVCFFFIGGFGVYLGLLFLFGAGLHYKIFMNQLLTSYTYEANWGVVTPIAVESMYTPIRGVESATKWSGMKRSGK